MSCKASVIFLVLVCFGGIWAAEADSTASNETNRNISTLTAEQNKYFPFESLRDGLLALPSLAQYSSSALEIYPNADIAIPVHYGVGAGVQVQGSAIRSRPAVLDGIRLSGNLWGLHLPLPELNALERISIHRGVEAMKFTDNSGGMIQMVSHSGGDKHRVSLGGLFGDHQALDVTDLRSSSYSFGDFKDLEFSAGGPAGLLPDGSYFLSGRLESNAGHIEGERIYALGDYGNDVATGDNQLVSMSHSERANLFGALEHKPHSNLTVNMVLVHTEADFQLYDHAYRRTPDGDMSHSQSGTFGAMVANHQVMNGLSHAFRFGYATTEGVGHLFDDELDPRYEVLNFNWTPVILRDPYGFDVGMTNPLRYSLEMDQKIAQWDVLATIKPLTVAGGIEGRWVDLAFEEKHLQNIGGHDLDSLGNPIVEPGFPENINRLNYPRQSFSPKHLNAYVTISADWRGFSVGVGARHDRMSPGVGAFVDVRDPLSIANFGANRFKEPENLTATSPRIWVTYAFGGLRLSAGRARTARSFPYQYYYANRFLDSRFTLEQAVVGNGGLDFEQSIHSHFDASFDFNPDLYIGFSLTTSHTDEALNLMRYVSLDNVRYYMHEVNSHFRRRSDGVLLHSAYNGDKVQASASYQYSDSEHQRVVSQYTLLGGEEMTIYSGWLPLAYVQKHLFKFSAAAALPFGLHYGMYFNYGSGWPYSPFVSFIPDELTASGYYAPAIHKMDIRIRRDFDVGAFQCALILDVLNLYNQLDQLTVYASTGTALIDDYTASFSGDTYYIRPDFYSTPRMFKFGFKLTR